MPRSRLQVVLSYGSMVVLWLGNVGVHGECDVQPRDVSPRKIDRQDNQDLGDERRHSPGNY